MFKERTIQILPILELQKLEAMCKDSNEETQPEFEAHEEEPLYL